MDAYSETKTMSDKSKFYNYMKKFNKTYLNDQEHLIRFENYKLNMQRALEHNIVSKGMTFYGETKFSDLSDEEFRLTLKSSSISSDSCFRSDSRIKKYMLMDIPLKFDWRERNKISPNVIDQKSCLCCWAISIVGVMESMAAIQYHRPPDSLSIQEIVDCVQWSHHCHGGVVENALLFMSHSKMAVGSEAFYPNIFIDESCHGVPKHGLKVKDYWKLCNEQSDVVLSLIANHGPLIANVNANSWINYVGGIIHINCDGDVLNHAVQIVGYDKTGPMPYYIVKNSWGPNFGVNGYVYVAIGNNVCGIESDLSYLDVTT